MVCQKNAEIGKFEYKSYWEKVEQNRAEYEVENVSQGLRRVLSGSIVYLLLKNQFDDYIKSNPTEVGKLYKGNLDSF